VLTRGADQRSLAIDLLRGVAVAMVMAAHLPFSHAGFSTLGGGSSSDVFPPARIADLMAHGHYGVQLFLVISGYCIHTRWARKAELDTRIDFFAFWRRRLTRLYPPYLLALLTSAAFTLLAARFFPGSVAEIAPKQLAIDLVVLLLLAQNLTDASARIGNPPFWSLALEEQLYLLYFPLLSVRRKRGWAPALGLSLFVTLAWIALGRVVPDSWSFGWYRAGPAYWFAWVLGALAAEAHLGVVRLPSWTRAWWLFPIVCALGGVIGKPFEALFVTVSFFFLIRATTEAEQTRGEWMGRWLGPMVKLGKISYGVYLVHNLAFVVSKRLLIALPLPSFVVLVLRLAAGLVAGYVLFLTVEQPFLRLAGRVRIPMLRDGPPAPTA
jgi:peptidoglycan/LPS O-acetylase OafA/YrhL